MDFGTVTWQPVSPAVWLQFDGSEFFHSLLPDSHPISIGCPGGINRGQHAPPSPSRETDDSKKLHWRYLFLSFLPRLPLRFTRPFLSSLPFPSTSLDSNHPDRRLSALACYSKSVLHILTKSPCPRPVLFANSPPLIHLHNRIYFDPTAFIQPVSVLIKLEALPLPTRFCLAKRRITNTYYTSALFRVFSTRKRSRSLTPCHFLSP